MHEGFKTNKLNEEGQQKVQAISYGFYVTKKLEEACSFAKKSISTQEKYKAKS